MKVVILAGGKGLFFLGLVRNLPERLAPPLRGGFVYDTPLKNFPSF